jgi:hypothetical protein
LAALSNAARPGRAPPGYPVVAFSGGSLRTYLKEHLISCGRDR